MTALLWSGIVDIGNICSRLHHCWKKVQCWYRFVIH